MHHGLKFCIPHNHIKIEEVCSEFEVLAGQLQNHKPGSEPEKKTLNAKLVSVAFNFKENQSSSQKQSLYNDFSKIASNLYKNPNIIISRPDKGTGVVLLQKDQNLEKTSTLLSHKTKFLQLGPYLLMATY